MKQKSSFHFKILPFLKTAVFSPAFLQMGISGKAESFRFVLVRKSKGNNTVPLAWGNNIPLLLRLFYPPIAHADTGMTPVYIISGNIGDETPEEWIDNNEESLIRAGFNSEMIVTDYVVFGKKIVSVSIMETACNSLYSELEKVFPIISLQPPLQGLASIYRKVCESPWVLWKIDNGGSIIGRIEAGTVVDICHFWAGVEAYLADPTAGINEIWPLLMSISKNAIPLRIMIWATTDIPKPPDNNIFHDCQFIEPPETLGLPKQYHEAYGNALYSGSQFQLAPLNKRIKTEAFFGIWFKIINSIRNAAAALIILALL